MNNSTAQTIMQDIIVQKFERVAAKIAGKYQKKLRGLTGAHRRDRFIEWVSDDDDLWFKLSEGHFPNDDSYSIEKEKAIWEGYYNSLSDDQIRTIEKVMRLEYPDFYWDDSNDPDSVCYYSDNIVGIRNQWSRRVSIVAESARELLVKRLWDNLPERAENEEDDPGDEEYNRKSAAIYAQRDIDQRIITNIRMKYSPAVFHCETCGRHSYSHDETGHLIADVGLWALSDGEPVSYLVCEECAGKPDVTQAILGRLFAEREQFWRWEEERKERDLREMLIGKGIDPDTGEDIDPQPDPANSAQTGQTTSTPGAVAHSPRI